MHGHSFERLCTKFSMCYPYTLQMVKGVRERRSTPLARALRAVHTPLQMSGKLYQEIRN